MGTLPRATLANADIARIINSNEVQSVLTPAKTAPKVKSCRQRKNPLKNLSVLGRLCPWAAAAKRVAKKSKKTVVKKSDEMKKKLKANKKAFFSGLEGAYAVAPAEVVEEEE